jgi:hypothetical protein
MPSWGDLIEQNGGSRPELYEGIINEDAPDTGTMIEVIVPAFDKELTWGPCPWMPREDGVLPVEGDRCLLGLGTTGNAGEPTIWIVAWWPN